MKRTKGVNQELKYTIKNCVEIMAQNIRRDKLVLFVWLLYWERWFRQVLPT